MATSPWWSRAIKPSSRRGDTWTSTCISLTFFCFFSWSFSWSDAVRGKPHQCALYVKFVAALVLRSVKLFLWRLKGDKNAQNVSPELLLWHSNSRFYRLKNISSIELIVKLCNKYTLIQRVFSFRAAKIPLKCTFKTAVINWTHQLDAVRTENFHVLHAWKYVLLPLNTSQIAVRRAGKGAFVKKDLWKGFHLQKSSSEAQQPSRITLCA